MEKLNFEIYDNSEFRHKIICWIAEYAYRKANPGGKRDCPSIVYEQVEKDFTEFLKTV